VSFPNRIAAVILATEDVARARAFYEGLGWSSAAEADATFVPFALAGIGLVVQDRAAALEEFGADPASFRDFGVLTAVREPDQVDAAIAHAEAAGARVTAPARERPFGRGGSVADPDGNVWEVAWSETGSLGAPPEPRDGASGMPARLNTVTVTTPSVLRLRDFYERLGFATHMAPGREDIAQFQLRGSVFSTWIDEQARTEVADPLLAAGFPYRHFELGIAHASAEAADAGHASAVAAGATSVTEPATAFWGGRSGYFADPDGFLFESVHLPGSSFTERGGLILPAG
jgi:uncharacterized glyoxalase superfamily protein PhnB